MFWTLIAPEDKRKEVTVDLHRARAENLEIALGKSCAYAEHLWRIWTLLERTWWPACRRCRRLSADRRR
jgi:hypothetical protein